LTLSGKMSLPGAKHKSLESAVFQIESLRVIFINSVETAFLN
jgi:hypothetical protein